MEWIIANKEWVFSGIGVFAISLIIGITLRHKHVQKQRSGANSRNLQSGRDINIGKPL